MRADGFVETTRELLNVVYLSKSNESDWRRKLLDNFFPSSSKCFNFYAFFWLLGTQDRTIKPFSCSSISSIDKRLPEETTLRAEDVFVKRMKNCYLFQMKAAFVRA